MSHMDNKLPTKDAGLDQLKQGVEKAKQGFDKARQEQASTKRGPGRPPRSGTKKR
jgi:hypothetical protein